MAVPPLPEQRVPKGKIPGNPAKPALRAELRARRAAHAGVRGPDGIRADSEAAAGHLLPHIGTAAIVALYRAFHDELDPAPLAAMLAARGQRLALPALLDDVTMVFRSWFPGDPLERGPFRLHQPLATAATIGPDIVVAPLVGFDRAGGRIGQGASHFDRAFARLPGARRLGFAWALQEVQTLPRDPWDMPLHAVVTEQAFVPMPEPLSEHDAMSTMS